MTCPMLSRLRTQTQTWESGFPNPLPHFLGNQKGMQPQRPLLEFSFHRDFLSSNFLSPWGCWPNCTLIQSTPWVVVSSLSAESYSSPCVPSLR